jgi:hypothetical protein
MQRSFESEVAAAVCYLMLVDPATLDPDGDLTAAFWPYDLETYRPGNSPLANMRLALNHLAHAYDEASGDNDE